MHVCHHDDAGSSATSNSGADYFQRILPASASASRSSGAN
jgi:hypothetical protein